MGRQSRRRGEGLMAGRSSRVVFARRRAAGGTLLLTCLAMLLSALAAAPARAVVVEAAGGGFGVTPVRGFDARTLPGAQRARASLRKSARVRGVDELPLGGGELEYLGGPVMHSNTTHVIYWEPNKEFSTTTKPAGA